MCLCVDALPPNLPLDFLSEGWACKTKNQLRTQEVHSRAQQPGHQYRKDSGEISHMGRDKTTFTFWLADGCSHHKYESLWDPVPSSG